MRFLKAGASDELLRNAVAARHEPPAANVAEIDELLRVLLEPERLPGAGVWGSGETPLEPLPMFIRADTVSESWFGVTRSGFASPLRSPMATP